tara:strand:+ start:82 stop:1077 length:996 start_codon:yes stop_codon:yes gene_type:complete
MQKPLIFITLGDPAGIGPEVTAKSLEEIGNTDDYHTVVIGSHDVFKKTLETCSINLKFNLIKSIEELNKDNNLTHLLDLNNTPNELQMGKVDAKSGKASVEWVLKAGELASKTTNSAIVTAPINKEACTLAGYKDIGHMEIFQSQTNSKEVATMLVADNLRVVHLTTHRSLRIACDYVTKDNVYNKIKLTHDYFINCGFINPKIAVSALNPHASDGGILGDEEAKQISPAINDAKNDGINATGPIPADTVFNQAIDGKYDVVLAMYHDQGHIPIKVHNWEKSISVNLGLPFVRTSVDHGTAFDIAGKGIAHHASMTEAIRQAVSLCVNKEL